jgi:tRNA(Ile)-lysidine synthase
MNTQFFQHLLLLAPDAESVRFLLAVSGGRDSVVLAHLFANYGLHFDIAHCNFHLRGEESNIEMNFVRDLPFLTTQRVFVKEFDTLNIQQKSGKSLEMVARELRYQWFEEIGKDYDYLVTAHHANDNAETVLMNLLRGTGLRGICGIPQKNGKIIRPLLRFRGSEIERYADKQGIRFCVDSSNMSDDFLRNKIRHHIIPELEIINPNSIETFSKNSHLFLQQAQFFDAHIQQYKNKL